MDFHKNPATAIIIATLVLAVILGISEGQTQGIPSCGSKLIPCYSFINGTGTPDNSCCGSIRQAVRDDLPCLCTLYSDPTLLSSFNISIDQALGLSRRCNIPNNLSACNSTGSPGTSPSTPGAPGSDRGGASSTAWAGMTSLFLFWVTMSMVLS